MASSGLSIKDFIDAVVANEQKYNTVDFSHLGQNIELSEKQVEELAEGLKTNTYISTVNLEKRGVTDKGAGFIAEVLKVNSTITKIDLGYNNITGAGMKIIADSFKVNTVVTECKLHRQEKDMGTAVEDYFVEMWDVNTTCCKMYITFHDRRCNQKNTISEVRNKKIAAHIKAGKNWDHLDPAKAEETAKKLEAELKEREEAQKKLNAPISEKVASTGGPYTYKQLTCTKKFQPDDVDAKNRETFLNDEEFLELFGSTKEEFSKLPQWKKLNLKKNKNLH